MKRILIILLACLFLFIGCKKRAPRDPYGVQGNWFGMEENGKANEEMICFNKDGSGTFTDGMQNLKFFWNYDLKRQEYIITGAKKCTAWTFVANQTEMLRFEGKLYTRKKSQERFHEQYLEDETHRNRMLTKQKNERINALTADYRKNLQYDKTMKIGGEYPFSTMSCILKGVEVQPDPEGEGVLVSARLGIHSRKTREIYHSNICGWNYITAKTDADDVVVRLWTGNSHLLLESSQPEKQHRREDTAVSLSRGTTEVLVPVAWYGPDPEAQKLAAAEKLGWYYGLNGSEAMQAIRETELPVNYALIDINTVIYLLDLTEILEN